jgi:DNA-nicking Smr family endonuclease
MVEKDRKHINSGDAALFKDLIGETRPVKSRPRTISKPAPSTRPTPKQPRGPIGHNAASFMPEAPTAGADEQLSYRRDGVSERRMRDLRRGRIAIQADLDLHGMTTAEAYPVLCDFLADCAERNRRCLRIVHGKGLRSGERGAVLKGAVNHWLRQFDSVLAFCSAPANDGGTGAAYVLLKRA